MCPIFVLRDRFGKYLLMQKQKLRYLQYDWLVQNYVLRNLIGSYTHKLYFMMVPPKYP